MPARSLDGAAVAVIGAAGGLGGPISALLADRGANLILAGPHRERLEALDLPTATIVELDVRDPAAGDRLADAARSVHGRLDGLVNAAGRVGFGNLVDHDDLAIEELFLTNVVGPLWLVRRVTPLLAESKGFLVQISAVVAEQPLPGMAVYSATKAALTAADRALTRELRRSGIVVCDVRPPHTETGLASRPLTGTAPRLPTGLAPQAVAARIVTAIEQGETEVAAEEFGSHDPDDRLV